MHLRATHRWLRAWNVHNGIVVGLLSEIEYHFHIDCIFNQNHVLFPNAFGCFLLCHALRFRTISVCVGFARPNGGKGPCRFCRTADDPRLAFSQACCNNVSLFSCVSFPHDCQAVKLHSNQQLCYSPLSFDHVLLTWSRCKRCFCTEIYFLCRICKIIKYAVLFWLM